MNKYNYSNIYSISVNLNIFKFNKMNNFKILNINIVLFLKPLILFLFKILIQINNHI